MHGIVVYKLEDGTITDKPEGRTIVAVAPGVTFISLADWVKKRNEAEPHTWPNVRSVNNAS